MFANVLLATDGSDHAEHALEVAVGLAKQFNARLIIVHALTHDHPTEAMERMLEVEQLIDRDAPATADADDVMGIAGSVRGMSRKGDREARIVGLIGEQILKNARTYAEDADLQNVSTHLVSGDYANEILAIADKEKADVIVMGRRGLSALEGLITGSVSYKVAQRADCSVLTVK